jgi:hypothetical protein
MLNTSFCWFMVGFLRGVERRERTSLVSLTFMSAHKTLGAVDLIMMLTMIRFRFECKLSASYIVLQMWSLSLLCCPTPLFFLCFSSSQVFKSSENYLLLGNKDRSSVSPWSVEDTMVARVHCLLSVGWKSVDWKPLICGRERGYISINNLSIPWVSVLLLCIVGSVGSVRLYQNVSHVSFNGIYFQHQALTTLKFLKKTFVQHKLHRSD